MNEEQFRKELRRVITRDFGDFHGCMQAAATAWGEHRSYLCAVLSGKNPPSPKILVALGYHKVVYYEPVKTKCNAR